MIGAMGDDLAGDFVLTTHRVHGGQHAFELTGFGDLVEQLGSPDKLSRR
ncbi:MAG: hypothetical protein ACREDV_04970 [Methylocella sp.]